MSDLMFNTIILSVASTGLFFGMAVFVWLRIRNSHNLEEKEAELNNQRTAAMVVRAGNWASIAVNIVIGVLLGVAFYGVAELIVRGAWLAASIIVVLSVALFLIVILHDYIGEKIFPSGIRPARKPQKKPKASLPRRLSLPAGLVLGVVLAALGLDEPLTGWLF